MKKLSENIWFNIAFILTLTFLGLGVALYDSYELAFETLKNINLIRLGMILFWGILPTLIWGLILTIMARQIEPTYRYRHGVVNAFIGGFMSGITPSSTGGQVAQITTYKRQGLTAFQGAGLVWMDFYLYSVSLVVITLGLYFFNVRQFESLSITLIFGLGLTINVLIIMVLGLMVINPNLYKKMSDWIVEKVSKSRWVKDKEALISGWNESMDHFHEAMFAVKQSKAMLSTLLLLNGLRLVVYFASPFAIAQIMGLNLDWADFTHLLALSAFVIMANTFVPLPGASGATESVFVLSYSTVIGKAAAASTMILWRFATFHFILIIGGYLYLHNRHTHLRQLRRETSHEEAYRES